MSKFREFFDFCPNLLHPQFSSFLVSHMWKTTSATQEDVVDDMAMLMMGGEL